MRRRKPIQFGAVAMGGCLLSLASLAWAQQPAEPAIIPANSSPQSLKIRYAETCLELTKIDLQLLEEANRRAPNTYTAPELQRQQDAVQLAEERLRAAQQLQDDENDFVVIQRFRAEQAAERAKRAYYDALENKRRDPAYSELKLKRLQLDAEKAQLQVAMWKDPTTSLVDHVHWELGRLSEEVLALEKRLEDLALRVGED